MLKITKSKTLQPNMVELKFNSENLKKSINYPIPARFDAAAKNLNDMTNRFVNLKIKIYFYRLRLQRVGQVS